jgi:hypothetical protein
VGCLLDATIVIAHSEKKQAPPIRAGHGMPDGCVRYPDGGRLDAAERARRQQARLSAAK